MVRVAQVEARGGEVTAHMRARCEVDGDVSVERATASLDSLNSTVARDISARMMLA